jgi:hypothetical protein
MEDFEYGEPLQGGDEKVTRQVGINPVDAEAELDQKFAKDFPVIQGSADILTTRQKGLGQVMAGDTLLSDRPLEPGARVIVSDRPAAPAPPPVDITRSDDGGRDPRDASSGPQAFAADQLEAAKAAKKKAQ